MRDLKTIVTRELANAGISRNTGKQQAMTRIVDRMLANGKISETEYQNATLYGLEYVGMASTTANAKC